MTPVQPRRRGVFHHATADIQNIRELLRGYGTAKGVVTELIQNAEDAGARRMDLVLCPGFQKNASHALLSGPGLCAINDGRFEPQHLDAIFQLGLGTKAADARSIGRFGKGLKSLFALCEAFFVFARTDLNAGWMGVRAVCEFFNPWHDWKHRDWDQDFDARPEEIRVQLTRAIEQLDWVDKAYLAFWFPLRCADHEEDQDGPVDPIYHWGGSTRPAPGDDPVIGNDFREALEAFLPSFAALHRLEEIRYFDYCSGDRLTMAVVPGGIRPCDPVDQRESDKIRGAISLRRGNSGDSVECSYSGIVGRLSNPAFEQIKDRQDWPRVVDVTAARGETSTAAKGEPHFGCILASEATREPAEEGHLDIRWCVYLPVAHQEADRLPLRRLHKRVFLSLHGFFFLDSNRVRIDGLDDAFEPAHSTARSACIEWNRRLAFEGTLSHVPEALDYFARNECLLSEQAAELAQAIRGSRLWRDFASVICGRYQWLPRLRRQQEQWACVAPHLPVLELPALPRGVVSADFLVSIFPALNELCEAEIIVLRSRSNSFPEGLRTTASAQWPEDLLMRMLSDVRLPADGDNLALSYLNDFLSQVHDARPLPEGVRELVSDLPLIKACSCRTRRHDFLTLKMCRTALERHALFAAAEAGEALLQNLVAALPNWNGWTMDATPKWAELDFLTPCQAETAAAIVLAEDELGTYSARKTLAKVFVARQRLSDEERRAARFLLHGSPGNKADTCSSLLVAEEGSGGTVWGRIMQQILDLAETPAGWKLVKRQLVTALSDEEHGRLGITAVGPKSVLAELISMGPLAVELAFPADTWSEMDVGEILTGVAEAGADIPAEVRTSLRRLVIHSVEGTEPPIRLSVSGAAGDLLPGVVLSKPGPWDTFVGELRTVWSAFLSETRIIRRNTATPFAQTVQDEIFTRIGEDGETLSAELSWNTVVGRCVELEQPSRFAPLIMEALRHGDEAARGISRKLKSTLWLPMVVDRTTRPADVINFEGLEDDLGRVFDPTDRLTGTRMLAGSVTAHAGFNTLRKYFPRIEEAVKCLAEWLEAKPVYHLGIEASLLRDELPAFLQDMKGCSNVPVINLLQKMWDYRDNLHRDGMEQVLREAFLPAVAKPFEADATGNERLLAVLHHLRQANARIAFESYLSQALRSGVARKLLPRLELVSKNGDWRPATRLIWPSEGLDRGAQLCERQAAILARLDDSRTASSSPDVLMAEEARRGVLPAPPDFDVSDRVLQEYLEPFCDAFGENLPAALVAVMGSRLNGYLAELLDKHLQMQPDDFREWLIPTANAPRQILSQIKSERFLVEVAREQSLTCMSITGELIEVPVSAAIESLLLGDPQDLWLGWYHEGKPVTRCHKIRFRHFTDPAEIADPVAVFSRTVEHIVRYVHCNGVLRLCPDVRPVIEQLADTGQADIRRSQLYLLDMAEARLKELGVRGDPPLAEVVRIYDQGRQARLEAKEIEERLPARAKEKLAEAKILEEKAENRFKELLLQSDGEPSRRALLEAVRRKMRDYRYAERSIPFEIFQNADDAAGEWAEMHAWELPESARHFVIRLDSGAQTLDLIHWGRPINQHSAIGFDRGKERGYDRDLQKMMTLNFSDKGLASSDDPGVEVTGRFGLGFKSVFFLGDRPEIISGRLAFVIEGGFYPVKAEKLVAKELRQLAARFGDAHAKPTVICLRLRDETAIIKARDVLIDFRKLAPYLAAFARHVGWVHVEADGTSEVFHMDERPLLELDGITVGNVGDDAHLLFRLRGTARETWADIAFRLDRTGVRAVPPHVPNVWITAPTSETSAMGFAVNAPFQPDAGRLRLALEASENRDLTRRISHAWARQLLDLYAGLERDWLAAKQELGLAEDCDPYSFWESFWNLLKIGSAIPTWERLNNDGGEILRMIVWGEADGGFRRLIEHREAIPSGLPKDYRRLLRLKDIDHVVRGALSKLDNQLFAAVMSWGRTRSRLTPARTVAGDVFDALHALVEKGPAPAEVRLQDVLATEVRRDQAVDPETANRIGGAIDRVRWNRLNAEGHGAELQSIRSFLDALRFQAASGGYRPAEVLVCARKVADEIDDDEALRAKFAPPDAVLSDGYAEPGIRFFALCRQRLNANAELLAAWALNAEGASLSAVFQYIQNGSLGQQLADELGMEWLNENLTTEEFRSLNKGDREEVFRLFGKVTYPPETPISPPIRGLSREDAFTGIVKWWEAERGQWIRYYEEHTYPIIPLTPLSWPGEDAFTGDGNDTEIANRERWITLFMVAALSTQGWNKLGRDVGFLTYFREQGWLRTLARLDGTQADYIRILDEYLDRSIAQPRYYASMKNFITFYASSKYLGNLLEGLRSIEVDGADFAFDSVFAPRINPLLSGAGIDAPPLDRGLGIGGCHLLRELFRFRRITNPYGHKYSFVPVRKVLLLCEELFGVDRNLVGATASAAIYTTLEEIANQVGGDPTFRNCFDIPLQILAENIDDVQQRVLKTRLVLADEKSGIFSITDE